VRRPLLWVFVACLVGDATARGVLPGSLVVGLGCIALLPGVRGRLVRALARQGLGPFSLALFCALAALRIAIATAPGETTARGQWRTLTESPELVGHLEGQAQRYELPDGAVRDGEWVELLAAPAPPAQPRASGEHPYRRRPQGTLDLQVDELRRLAPAPSRRFPRLVESLDELRQAGLARTRRLVSPLARGLAGALLFGDRGALPPGLADLFTRTGTRHALAVSGLHVALVAALWIWPLGALCALGLRPLAARAAGLQLFARKELWRVVLLALFVPLAGAGAPVVRAALALALTQLAGLAPARGELRWPRRTDGLSLWALAGSIEWLARRDAFTSLSLQLSYGATLGLLLLTAPLASGLRARLPGGGRVAETNRRGRRRPAALRIALQKTIDAVTTGLAASLAANLATLPVAWTVFGEWSASGPLATLLLLPLMALFMGLAWGWVVWPSALVEGGLGATAELMTALLRAFDHLPGTPVPLPERPALWLLAAGAASLCAAALHGPWRGRWARAALGAWGVALLPWGRGATQLELRLLDVGHGTCALLRVPREGTWLFDAGSRDGPRVAREALGEVLRELDVGPVGVALSHVEMDHAGALDWVVERYPPRRWLGALPAQLGDRLARDCDRLDLESGRLSRSSDCGDRGGLELVLLRGLPEEGNEGSRSLEVRVGGRRLLLCGDAEGDGLARQLRAGDLRGPYDLVLFPHHGSETPWLGPFLEAARPEQVWFSCAGRPAVADELDRRGIPWRSTAREGTLLETW
jgi:competence protein ComEC